VAFKSAMPSAKFCQDCKTRNLTDITETTVPQWFCVFRRLTKVERLRHVPAASHSGAGMQTIATRRYYSYGTEHQTVRCRACGAGDLGRQLR
jgi:hypothetical protein